MDKQSHELAVHAFSMLNEHISPIYLQARQDFLNRLALSDVTLESLQGKLENDTHNREVITSFCNTLPGARVEGEGNATEVGVHFESKEVDEIAAVQSSVVFVSRVIQGIGNTVVPFYVVGLDTKNRRALLAPPAITVEQETWSKLRQDKPSVQVIVRDELKDKLAIVSWHDRDKMTKTAITDVAKHIDVMNKLYLPNATEYAEQIFDKTKGTFIVGISSPGSKALEVDYKLIQFELINYLSDREFATFQVMDHLSRLALAFTRGQELLSVLSKKN